MAADPVDSLENMSYSVQSFMAAKDMETCWSFLELLGLCPNCSLNLRKA